MFFFIADILNNIRKISRGETKLKNIIPPDILKLNKKKEIY